MTQETETVSQRARDFAWVTRPDNCLIGHDRDGFFAGNYDDTNHVQRVARFEREVSTNKDETIAKLRAEIERLREATSLLDELGGNFLRALTSTKKEG